MYEHTYIHVHVHVYTCIVWCGLVYHLLSTPWLSCQMTLSPPYINKQSTHITHSMGLIMFYHYWEIGKLEHVCVPVWIIGNSMFVVPSLKWGITCTAHAQTHHSSQIICPGKQHNSITMCIKRHTCSLKQCLTVHVFICYSNRMVNYCNCYIHVCHPAHNSIYTLYLAIVLFLQLHICTWNCPWYKVTHTSRETQNLEESFSQQLVLWRNAAYVWGSK
jgi:hypothetical protein